MLTDAMRRLYRGRRLVISVHLDLTLRCNFGCVHCLHGTDDSKGHPIAGELSTAEWLQVLDDLRTAQVFRLVLSGGEVWMHSGLEPILEKARRLAFSLQLKTNGALLTRERARLLVRLGVREVDVSIYSLEPAVHDGITRRPGSLAAILANAEAARAEGLLLRFVLPMMRDNLASISETARGVRALGHPLFIGYHIQGDCDPGDDRWAMNVDEAEVDRRKADIFAATAVPSAPRVRPLDSPGCRAGITNVHVSPEGDVSPCLGSSILFGNVREASFGAILEGPARHAFLQKSRRDWIGCQGCVLLGYCTHCLVEAEKLTGDPWRRHPYICGRTAGSLRRLGGHRVGREYVFEPVEGTPGEER